ncbi:MAG: hydantoinase B/oxoprolinase family protein [Planctomycetes bacterium]|nr:hydantoinase B/oxoprolinase family protein [Planctomycetota bacterium]
MNAAELSILHHALVGAAEEMGEALKRAAFSPNIKERQDYSCAMFDARGRLLAQAAHLPVHLGSMPASVAAVLRTMNLSEGECAVVNDPYEGGTHLPDLTVVAPVFAAGKLAGYTANRAHHADIGGASPGSMAPQSDLMAEGIVIPPALLRTSAGLLTDTGRFILANTRTPRERDGDLKAQLSACDRGAARMVEVRSRIGGAAFERQCKALFAHSRALMRENLTRFRPGVYEADDYLDDDGAGTRDIPIRVTLAVTRETLRFDFSGSAPQVRGGVNAVLAVTQSAAFYAVLCLCNPRPPINAGCFECIEVIAPDGSVVNARRPAPVAGGNVETSQRIVDVCLAALAQAVPGVVPAHSQGTMNNLTIGGAWPDGRPFTYYETIAGGCGGGPAGAGASATHSHMTNTLNTPVEALEHAYPLRVEEYSIREGSGGAGEHPGGEGVIRRVRALSRAQFALLAERRRRAPGGAAAGTAGAPGLDRVVRKDGSEETLESKCQGELRPGDAIEIQTPGGGGWG